MVTCYVRYTLDLEEIVAFKKYAQLWIHLINQLGGQHHGYFLPSEDERAKNHGRFSFPVIGSEGSSNVAVAIFTGAHGSYHTSKVPKIAPEIIQRPTWRDTFDLSVFLVQNVEDPPCAGAGY